MWKCERSKIYRFLTFLILLSGLVVRMLSILMVGNHWHYIIIENISLVQVGILWMRLLSWKSSYVNVVIPSYFAQISISRYDLRVEIYWISIESECSISRRVLVGCYDENIASQKIIESNGRIPLLVININISIVYRKITNS